MLTEAVEALQGKKRRHRPLVTIDLPVRALIPPDYIERSARRMEVYRRIVEATEEEELEGLLSEVRDRYGPPPAPVINLFRLAQLRKLCEELGIREITASGSRVTFRLRRDAEKFYQQLLEVKGQAWDGLKARLNRSLGEVELSSAADFWRGEGALVEMLETLGEMSLVASATGHH
jgi:transcription-repair coupling factor (superfamily II helicase)